jgi:biopolymer transport protein ExbB
MKKLIALFTLAGMLIFASSSFIYAQDENTTDEAAPTEQVESTDAEAEDAAPQTEEKPMHQQLKIKIIEGGPMFMGIVILTLVLGLALCFERIIYLNLATTNTEKLLKKVEAALNDGGIEAAKEV